MSITFALKKKVCRKYFILLRKSYVLSNFVWFSGFFMKTVNKYKPY